MNSRPNREVRPWGEVKGQGGRKKQSNTEGHACPNSACRYHGIRDQAIHALVLQEKRGQTGAIWRLRCQACGKRFSERHDTVLARLKTRYSPGNAGDNSTKGYQGALGIKSGQNKLNR